MERCCQYWNLFAFFFIVGTVSKLFRKNRKNQSFRKGCAVACFHVLFKQFKAYFIQSIIREVLLGCDIKSMELWGSMVCSETLCHGAITSLSSGSVINWYKNFLLKMKPSLKMSEAKKWAFPLSDLSFCLLLKSHFA